MPQGKPKTQSPEEKFKSARAAQAEVNQAIETARGFGSKFGMGKLAKQKAKADSVAFDAGQALRKSRIKKP